MQVVQYFGWACFITKYLAHFYNEYMIKGQHIVPEAAVDLCYVRVQAAVKIGIKTKLINSSKIPNITGSKDLRLANICMIQP